MATAEAAKYWSGAIKFEGLGNGVDFGKITEGIMAKEGRHLKGLQRWRKTWDLKSKELSNLNTKVQSLQTMLEKMDTEGELFGKKVSSTLDTVLTATATGDSEFTAHKVEVNQLATNEQWAGMGKGFASVDDAVSTKKAEFTFKYAGKEVTLNIASNTKLKNFIIQVNNHTDLAGKVRAEAINDGTSFKIRLKGLNLGKKNSIEIVNSTIPGLSNGSFTRLQAAQDAQIKVDGFPPGSNAWITRETNAISDAIQGVTLNLKSAKPGTEIDVAVTHDKDVTKKRIKEFVAKLNEVRVQIKKLVMVKGKGKDAKGSLLTGNYGVEMVSQKLKSLVSSQGLGFKPVNSEGVGDPFIALSVLGITTDSKTGSVNYGLLKVDETKLDKALAEKPKDVAKLFVADYLPSSTSSDFQPGTLIKGTTKGGTHAVKYTIAGGKITSATINGKVASVDGFKIIGKAGTESAGLLIDVTNTKDGSYSGDILVKVGKIREFLESVRSITSADNGPLKIIEKNYKDIISQIDKKLKREEKRLAQKERFYKNKFARLDALLGTYNKKQKMLASQVAKLGK